VTSIAHIKEPTLVDYLAGAIFANAPLLILASIFSFIEFEISLIVLSVLSFISVFIGAFVAGFLVAGKANTHYVRIGLMTGLFSFVLYGIFVSFIFGDKSGGLWVLIGFVAGSSAGGIFRRRKRDKQKKLTSNTSKSTKITPYVL
jgi:LPXTG-motif cell wall-anchored protein